MAWALARALLTSRAYCRLRGLCRRPLPMTAGEYRLLIACGDARQIDGLRSLLLPWRWRRAAPLVSLTGGTPLDAA